jgi:hypothetical protein
VTERKSKIAASSGTKYHEEANSKTEVNTGVTIRKKATRNSNESNSANERDQTQSGASTTPHTEAISGATTDTKTEPKLDQSNVAIAGVVARSRPKAKNGAGVKDGGKRRSKSTERVKRRKNRKRMIDT